MFEMWNNVSSKLEQVQQSQTQPQQPHTSSGSIKGIISVIKFVLGAATTVFFIIGGGGGVGKEENRKTNILCVY